jgi:two-component system sensor histidine kinase DegS
MLRVIRPALFTARRRQVGRDLVQERLARWVATPHLWLVVAMFVVAALLHYFEPIVVRIHPHAPWGLSAYSMDRTLFLLPVTYAGFVFGGWGGLMALVVAAAIMLPNAAVLSDDRRLALTQTGAVVLVGALVVSWFQSQMREKERSRETLFALESAQKELETHIGALRSEERALEALNAIYYLCTQSLDLDEILQDSLDKIVDVMKVDMAVVFLLNEEAQELELAAHRGVSKAFLAEVGRLCVGEGLNGRVAATGEPLIVANIAEDPRLSKAVVVKEGIKCQAIVPVKARGRVFGTVCAGLRSFHDFTEMEVQILGACGNAIGVALENARLYQRVRASEQRYRDLFENANDAIFAHDSEGRIFAANLACSRLSGYSKAELMGMNVRQLFPAAEMGRAEALEQLSSLQGENGRNRLELRLLKKGGSEITVELASTPIGDEGHEVGVQHIAHDITEQRQAQESLGYYVRQITRAQEDERLRLSRDLHDETTQSILLISQRLDNLVSSPRWHLGEDAKVYVSDVRELTLQTLSDLRRLSEALRPRILDDLGLVPALGWLADELARQTGVEARLEVDGVERDLPHDQQVLLFRIAQEALANVRRHSGATRAVVSIQFLEGRTRLTVRDDGRGFAVPARLSDLAGTGKLGILGMYERARLLRGKLSIQSEPEKGTTVAVEAPV